jgi:hypothetical protein
MFQINETGLIGGMDGSGDRCNYLITIKTSCDSPTYTNDHISLLFGDALGTEVLFFLSLLTLFWKQVCNVTIRFGSVFSIKKYVQAKSVNLQFVLSVLSESLTPLNQELTYKLFFFLSIELCNVLIIDIQNCSYMFQD